MVDLALDRLAVQARRLLQQSNGSQQTTASKKLDESNKYTVKLQGTMAPYTNDQFMAS